MKYAMAGENALSYRRARRNKQLSTSFLVRYYGSALSDRGGKIAVVCGSTPPEVTYCEEREFIEKRRPTSDPLLQFDTYINQRVPGAFIGCDPVGEASINLAKSSFRIDFCDQKGRIFNSDTSTTCKFTSIPWKESPKH